MSFLNLFTLATTGFSVVVYLLLIYLIFRKNSKSWLNRSLALYLFFLNLVQISGGIIMLVPDPELSLFLYRLATVFALFLAPCFYIFGHQFLKQRISKWVLRGLVLFCGFWGIANLIVPRLIVKDVVWSKTAQFYLLVINLPEGLIVSFFFLSLLLSVLFKLFKTYRKSRSPIERNRLKYLFLGVFIVPVGFLIILLPPFRPYPIDMIMMTTSGIIFAYTILRYQLLDIVVVVRKSLLYTILTAVVTGIYLFFSFSLQWLFQKPPVSFSLPTVISTALVVALIFQPLQMATQQLLNRLFSKRKYNPQELVARLSKIFSETLDLDLLATNFLNVLCQTLQIEKAVLFLVDEETNSLKVQKCRNLPQRIKKKTLGLRLPLIKFLSRTNKVQSKYTLEEKGISLEGLDKFGLEIFIPLKSRERLKGILVLGPKLSQELYSLEEFDLLEIIAHGAALALDNASLFSQLLKEKEKTEEARASLEIRVRARTRELKELAESLEKQVQERTKELREKIRALEKFQRLTVGRELKMVELKKEIKKLKKQLKK